MTRSHLPPIEPTASDLVAAHGLDITNQNRPGRPHLIFVIVVIALFMSTIDLTIVATALPAIHRDLRATISWAGWTITMYGLVQVIVMPIAGRFSEQFGRRRVFLYAVAIFTTASLLCGFADNIYLLVTFRGLQAIGGGAFMPAASGIVADHFGKNRDRALGLFQSFTAGGQIVGPVLGGLIVGYLSWRWIFFVNVPIGIVVLVLALKFIPESALQASKKIDLLGLVVIASLVFAAIFGVTELSTAGTQVYDPSFVVPELFAVVLDLVFARHTRRAQAPLIPLQLFRGAGFAALNSINFLFGSVAFGVAALYPLYAEQRYHLHPLAAGTLLTARAVGMMAVSAAASFALRRTGYRLPMTVGFSIGAAGVLVMSVAPRWGISPYTWLTMSAAITGIGIGIAGPASRNASMQLAPDQVAAIVGLRGMFTSVGIIISVAITTSVLNRSTDPGLTQAHVFWVVAGILLGVMVPLVYTVPDHKGSW